MADTPKIRFKGFLDAWEQRKLGDICEKTFGGGTPTTSNEEYWSGDIPWFQSSDIAEGNLFDIVPKKYISESGLTKSAAQLVPANSIAIVTRVGVGKLTFVPFPYTTSQDFLSLSRLKTEPIFTVYACYKKLQSESNAVQGTSIKGITKNEMLAKEILIPSHDEQKQIGAYFRNLDHLITLHQRKCDETKELKKYMMQKMFPRNGKKNPEIRFAGFTDAWEQRKLGELMNVTSVKRIHQSDWTDSGVRFLRARDIVAASKNEEPDDYLYISKEKYEEYSAISGKVDIDDLLVTGVGTIGVPYLVENTEPLYFKDGNIIWFQNQNEIDGKFLYYSFIGNGIQSFIKASAGTGTVGTYTIDTGKRLQFNFR